MDVGLIIAGLAMGLALSAPFGPVNLMVIRSTLRRGVGAGVTTGLGGTLADAAFAILAAFGFTAVARAFADHAVIIGALCGVILVVMGIYTARSAPHLETEPAELTRRARVAPPLAAFAATITNPGAMLGAFAMFGAMGGVLKLEAAPQRAIVAVAALACGSVLWWLFLVVIVNLARDRFSASMLQRLNRWTGVLIAAFGFVLLLRMFD